MQHKIKISYFPTMKHDKHRRRFFKNLNGVVSYTTVKRWCKMIPEDWHRNHLLVTEQFVHKKRSIENQRTVKGFLAENCSWKVFVKCLENSQKRSSNEVVQESLLNDEHQTQRKKFANWAREKRSTKKLQWESFFPIEIDGIFNSENDRMWAVKTEEKETARGNVCRKVMGWSEGVVPFRLFAKRHSHSLLSSVVRRDRNS